jgi:DNA-binding LytR/AlgR family response regulator
MIHIAFVEDDPATTELLQNCIDRYAREKRTDLQWTHYERAEDFLENYSQRFSLVLMDIRLGSGMTGMEAAQRLRRQDSSVQLIFITSLAQYAVKSYEVNALDFLLKPFSYAQFSMKMDKAVRLLAREEDVRIPVSTANGLKVLSSGEITYLEVSDHDLLYHTEKEILRTRDSLSRKEKELAGSTFVRTNVCYLVNLRYVSEIDGNMLVLVTGEKLAISRSRKKEVFSSLARYLGGSI